jgi:chemotaxis methyl-accepting protein methylase
MLFLSYQKSSYEFLRELLISNSLINNDFPIASYNSALVSRAQDLGFKKIDEYCRYVLYLPLDKLTREIRLIMLACKPIALFQEKDQLDGLSEKIISEMFDSSDKKQEKTENKSLWLKKVLTSEIKLKQSHSVKTINVLGIECATGEEIFSAVMRLRLILQDRYNLDVCAVDSKGKLLNKARKGTFSTEKLFRLDDNYRSLYLEKTPEELYRITNEIMNCIRFSRFDLLSDKEKTEDYEKYHLVFCSNIYRFYFKHIADRILMKTVPFLAKEGLLFLNAPNYQDSPPHEGLDFFQMGKTRIYKRNSKQVKGNHIPELSIENETMENQLLFCKFIFFENKLDEAQKTIDRFLEKSIDNFDANYLRGDIYAKKGEFSKAANQYSRVLIINPGFLPARYNLAAVNLLNNKKKQAIEEIETVIEKLGSIESSVFEKKVNIDPDAFSDLCRELKNLAETDEVTNLQALLQRTENRMKNTIEVPDIEIVDELEKRMKIAEAENEPQPNDQENATDKKVVIISELPSTRDYGEHDPWLQKQKEEEERQKEEAERLEREKAEQLQSEKAEAERIECERLEAEKEREKTAHAAPKSQTPVIDKQTDQTVKKENLDSPKTASTTDKLSPTRVERP